MDDAGSGHNRDKCVISVADPAVRALLPNYLARRAQDVASIREWVAAGAFEKIAVLAHRMRGSGSAYGVDFVTQIGQTMEAAAGSGDRAVIEREVSRLDEFLERVELA